MTEGLRARFHHNGGRAKLGLATALALVAGLAGATSATAAPGDNVTNARKCLRGGWQSLQTSTGRPFGGPISCVIYALRGGIFGVVVSPPPPGGGTP